MPLAGAVKGAMADPTFDAPAAPLATTTPAGLSSSTRTEPAPRGVAVTAADSPPLSGRAYRSGEVGTTACPATDTRRS